MWRKMSIVTVAAVVLLGLVSRSLGYAHPDLTGWSGDGLSTARYGPSPVAVEGSGAFDPVLSRSRMLHAQLGRFVQRDPLGYVDGMNVYANTRSNPSNLRDARGTAADPGTPGQRAEQYCGQVHDWWQAENERLGNQRGGRGPRVRQLPPADERKCTQLTEWIKQNSTIYRENFDAQCPINIKCVCCSEYPAGLGGFWDGCNR